MEQKEPVVESIKIDNPKESTAPKSKTVESKVNNTKQIAELLTIIDKTVIAIAIDMAEISELSNRMLSNYIEFSPYLDSYGTQIFGDITEKLILDLSLLSSEMKGYSSGLLSTRQQIASGNNINTQYWLTSGLADIINQQKQFKQRMLTVSKNYNEVLAAAKERISKLNKYQENYYPYPTYNYTPKPQNSECDNIEQKIRDDISSSGGFATESQIQALISKKKSELGCY